jgi:transmembrane sensor
MNPRSDPLARLTEAVVREQDRQLDRLDARHSDYQTWLRAGRRWSMRERLGIAGWTVAGAAAAAAVLVWWQTRALRYETDALEVVHGVDVPAWHAPAADGAIRFSDGSLLQLQKGAQARIDSLEANGALVQLDQGEMRASITKRARSAWRFKAGFFEVIVTGTRFHLSVEPDSGSVSIRMEEGSVRVGGCSLDELRLTAGQSATLHCDGARPRVDSIAREPSTQSSVAPARPAAAAPAASQSAASQQPLAAPIEGAQEAPVADAGAAPARWQTLASQGKFKEAYAAADAAGFDAQCEGASSRELLELADAAQFAGRGDRAAIALMTIRRRFPGTGASATAAFKLGRMAADQRGAWTDARQWFEACLAEAPSGPLAREAMGRLMEMDRAQGNLAGARVRAAQYLQRWPQGPHAELARALVAK